MKWQAKVAVQAVLGRVPGGESLNHRLQLHSGRHSPRDVRRRIAKAVAFLVDLAPHVSVEEKVIVEVGTGWDGLHPILLSCLGAERIVTYDHVRHVRWDHCELVVRELLAHEAMDRLCEIQPTARQSCGVLARCNTLDDLLQAAQIEYVAPGDACDTWLDDGTADIVYSAAVLEHLPENVIERLLVETKRILRPDGVFVARIGLHDHYHRADSSISRVNFLKYPEWLWAPLVKNRISYHNRLREKHYLQRFEVHGGRVLWRQSYVDDEDIAALETMSIDKRFRDLTPEELAVWRSDLVLDFPTASPTMSRPACTTVRSPR